METTILLNNKEIQIEGTKTETVDNVFDEILLSHGEDHVFTKLMLDGKTIEAAEEPSALKSQLTNYKKVEVFSKTRKDLLWEAVDSSFDYIESICQNIDGIVSHINNNNPVEANKQFAETIEIIDLYLQLMQNVFVTSKDMNLIENKDQDWQNLELHMFSVLKSLIPAKEKNDIIMLCDLLEYELKDNLRQWKIKVLSPLKILIKK